jgi:hypothetical protein
VPGGTPQQKVRANHAFPLRETDVRWNDVYARAQYFLIGLIGHNSMHGESQYLTALFVIWCLLAFMEQ